ncbi:MAG: peptidoglycan DD-metalloendopeptidase family protein [Clostridia bacterium]|nr:peptidoglycan DD-metalloendopeptidase family protein [Clostridia bacterium]
MKEKVIAVLEKIKNAPHFVKLICFLGISAIVMTLSLNAAGVVLAYNVNYAGNVIAQVNSKEDFASAGQLASAAIMGENTEGYIYAPKFFPTLTLNSRIDTSADIANAILENTAELKKTAALKVNGVLVGTAESSEEIEQKINNRLSSFNVADYECSAEFVDTIDLVSTYCSVNACTSGEQLDAGINNLAVKTTVKETTDVKISYKTVTQRSAEYQVGYYAVNTKGVNGLKHKVDNVVYLNGVEIERNSVEDVVVNEPVNEVVVVGTAAVVNKNGSSGAMVFPIPKSARYYISTYFGGDGGSHKGLDLAVSRGTPIYASLDGTVVEAGYKSDYGYYVLVDHGNGLKTRYAHNSQNLVSRGDKVTKGQTIALVGSTGRSTGNHLHFEVMLNGVRVNPLKYVG